MCYISFLYDFMRRSNIGSEIWPEWFNLKAEVTICWYNTAPPTVMLLLLLLLLMMMMLPAL